MEGKSMALEESGSPITRSRTLLQDADRLKELRYSTTKVERHLKQLVKSGEELQKARDDMYVKEQQWVMDMVDFNLHHDVRYLSLSLGEGGSAEKHPAAVLANTLKDLARQMYTLNKEVQEMVLQPMKQFLQVEVNGSVEMQKKLDLARERYQTASTKFSGVSHKTDMGHFTKWENEVAESKQEYDLIYFNGMTKMLEVERNKIHLVHSYFYSFYTAYQKFYDTTGHSLKHIMPEMQQWKQIIEEGRKKAKEQAAENDDIMLDHVSKLQQTGYKSTEALELLSPRVNMYGVPVQPDKQGYLFLKRVVKTTKGWKCSWFVLEKGILMYYRNIKSETPDGGLNLLLCTVKEVPEKHLCFQVISTDDRYVLRATNEAEYAEWLEALRNGIASQLANGCESATDSKRGLASSRGPAQELWLIEGNHNCADCGQKDPEWAALNLGVLICVKCSGIHRSLGVHISKVRSLELDKWEPQQLGLMKAIGNATANSLWEADVPDGWTAKRPDPESDGKAREMWIKAKYMEKSFVRKPNLSSEEINRNLRRSALENNFTGVVESLLWGADVNWSDPNEEMGTSIHALTRSNQGNVAMLELLLQNGGEVTILDERKRTPLHYAVESDRPDLCKILRSRGASPTAVDKDGQSSLDVAEAMGLEKCIAILKEEKREEAFTGKSAITSIGSTGLGGGLSASQSAEDMSKALRGSLNLLSEFSGPSTISRRETKDRLRLPSGSLKPRLITKIKDQVIGRKKSFTVSEPRQPAALPHRDRTEEVSSPQYSSFGRPPMEGVNEASTDEEEDFNESGIAGSSTARSIGEDGEPSSPGGEERRPLSARRHTTMVPPALDKAASMGYFQRAQRSGSGSNADEPITQQAEDDSEGAAHDGEGANGSGSDDRRSPMRGYIPRGSLTRRRKSTDLTPIVLGRAREKSKDGSSDIESTELSRTSGSAIVVRPSTSPITDDDNADPGAESPGQKERSWITSSASGVSTTFSSEKPSSPNSARSVTMSSRGTAGERSVPASPYASPTSSASSSPVPVESRGRRKSDASGTASPELTQREGRRKKAKDTSPSTSPSSPEPSAATASMTKKLSRSLRHSFGRRDQQELLRDSATWNAGESSSPQSGGKSRSRDPTVTTDTSS